MNLSSWELARLINKKSLLKMGETLTAKQIAEIVGLKKNFIARRLTEYRKLDKLKKIV
jgi:Fic family protein